MVYGIFLLVTVVTFPMPLGWVPSLSRVKTPMMSSYPGNRNLFINQLMYFKGLNSYQCSGSIFLVKLKYTVLQMDLKLILVIIQAIARPPRLAGRGAHE